MSLVPGERDHVAKKKSSEHGDLLHLYQIEFSQVKQRNVLRRPSHCIGHPRLDLDLVRARSLGGILHASAHSRGGVTYTPKYSCSLLYPFLCIHCGVPACHRYASLTTALSLLFLSGGNESYETKKETETSGAETGAATATQI